MAALGSRSRPRAGRSLLPSLALFLGLASASCSAGKALVAVDPRAAASFASLVRDHPLPPGLEFRVDDSLPPEARADLRLSFAPGPGEGRAKAVSAYAPYPVKRCWEEEAPRERFLPLADIALPDCVWTRDPNPDPQAEGELVLALSAKAGRPLRKWFESLPRSLRADMAWIAAVGDLMPGRGEEKVLLADKGIEKAFGDALPVLEKADFLIGNLEGAATARGKAAVKAYTFRFPPALAGKLKQAGFDYLSMANNHSFDYGMDGFLDTLGSLEAAGMGFSGAGRNEAAALSPYRASPRGQDISVSAFGAFRLELPDSALRAAPSRAGILLGEQGIEAIRSGAEPGAVDIAVVHGGTEYADAPSPALRALYRECVDAGADLVLASHPHVLQGIESYRGGLIVYSLGNFLFRGMEEEKNAPESMILRIGLYGGRVVAVDPVFVKVSDSGPRLAPPGAGKRFWRLSRELALP